MAGNSLTSNMDTGHGRHEHTCRHLIFYDLSKMLKAPSRNKFINPVPNPFEK